MVSSGRTPLLSAFLVLVLLVSLGLCTLRFFQNDFTPYGDGGRIMPYAERMDSVEEFYPLWNPYKMSGLPMFSTPERYVWVAKLIDATSSTRNLQLNMVFVGLALALCAAMLLLCRQMGLGRDGSLVALVLFASTPLMMFPFETGGINGLLAMLAAVLAMAMMVRHLGSGGRWSFALCAVCTGVNLVIWAHYSLVSLFPMLFFLVCFESTGRSPLGRIVRGVLYACGAYLVGILVCAVIFVPLVHYQLLNHMTYEVKSSLLTYRVAPWMLLRFLVPLTFEEAHRYYYSLAVLPLLICGLAHGCRRARYFYPLILSSVVALLLVGGMDHLFPFYYLVELFTKLPIVGKVRETYGIMLMLSVCLPVLGGLCFETVGSGHGSPPGWARWVPAVSVAGLVCLPLILQGLSLSPQPQEFSQVVVDFWRGNGAGMQLAGLVALLLLLALPYPRFSETRVRWFLVGIMAALVLYALPYALDLRGTVNRPAYSVFAKTLRKDDDYFRVFTYRFRQQASLGMPLVREVNDVDKYFSPELRSVMEWLYGQPIRAARMHWMKDRPPFEQWDERALYLLGVKYLITARTDDPGLEQAGLELLLENGVWQLWRRPDFADPTRVYYHWQSVDDMAEACAKMRSRDFDPIEDLLLEGGPVAAADNDLAPTPASLVSLRSDTVTYRVRTAADGMLFIPEVYDGGWTAEVDGVETPVLRADAAFRAVFVPRGEHQVVMRFRPANIAWGAALSLCSLAGLLIWAGGGVLRRRAGERRRPDVGR